MGNRKIVVVSNYSDGDKFGPSRPASSADTITDGAGNPIASYSGTPSEGNVPLWDSANGVWKCGGISGASDLPVVMHQMTTSQTDVVFGAFTFNSADYTATSVIKFKSSGYVTGAALTGTVTLYNVTDDSTAATLTFTSVTLAEQLSNALALPSSKKIYEVRLKVTGGGGIGSADYVVCEWVGIEIR